MTTARALIHGNSGPLRIKDANAGAAALSRLPSGEMVGTTVVDIKAVERSAVHLRMRGRNSVLGSTQRVMRVRNVTREIPPCQVDQTHGPGRTRGFCTPCYLRRYRSNALLDDWQRVPLTQVKAEIVQVADIKRNDLVVVLDHAPCLATRKPILDDGSLFGVEVTEPMAWLWGAIVGDGTVSEADIRVCAFGDFADQVTRAFDDAYSMHTFPHWSAGLIASNAELAKFLRSQGFWRRGEDKCVPAAVWSWPAPLRLAFCAGYAAADGYVDPRPGGGQRYDSCSRRLIDEVRTMHIELGHRVTNVSTNMRKKPIFINGKQVKHAKPLHNFVVNSVHGEPYSTIPKRIASEVIAGGFAVRVVLGVDPIEPQVIHDVTVDGVDNAVIDGVPIWPALHTASVVTTALAA